MHLTLMQNENQIYVSKVHSWGMALTISCMSRCNAQCDGIKFGKICCDKICSWFCKATISTFSYIAMSNFSTVARTWLHKQHLPLQNTSWVTRFTKTMMQTIVSVRLHAKKPFSIFSSFRYVKPESVYNIIVHICYYKYIEDTNGSPR